MMFNIHCEPNFENTEQKYIEFSGVINVCTHKCTLINIQTLEKSPNGHIINVSGVFD